MTYIFVIQKVKNMYITGESKNWGFFNQNFFPEIKQWLSKKTSGSWKNKQNWSPKISNALMRFSWIAYKTILRVVFFEILSNTKKNTKQQKLVNFTPNISNKWNLVRNICNMLWNNKILFKNTMYDRHNFPCLV